MKKQRFTKGLSLLLAVVLLVGIFTSCGSKDTADKDTASPEASKSADTAKDTDSKEKDTTDGVQMSAPGEFPIVDEPVELEVVINDVTYIGDLSENTFTQWYEEYTGVKVTYTEIPSAAIQEKVNLLLASNELPDIFMDTAQDIPLYGSRGVYLKLNDLIEEYGLETKKVFDQNDNLPGAITEVDGNIYALPNINACYHCNYSQRGFINTDWLETLGLDYPETTEEFEKVLTAFKEDDPNGNGIADEIPMSGADAGNLRPYGFLLNSFVYFRDGNYTHLDNGEVKFAATSDEAKEGLTWIKSLYDKELIDPMSLTQTDEQLGQLGKDPEAILIGSFPAFTWWQALGQDTDMPDKRSRQYEALSPLGGPEGARFIPTTGTAVQRNKFVITNACEYPEVAFRWADALYNEEITMASQVGVEGINWDTPPEGATGINGKPALYIQHALSDDDTTKHNTRVDNIFMANRTDDFRLGQMADYDDPETQWQTEPRLYNLTHDYLVPYSTPEKMVPALSYTEEEESEIALIRTQIVDHIQEQYVMFLTGNRDISTDWDTFVSEIENLGLGTYLETMQVAYDRQYK